MVLIQYGFIIKAMMNVIFSVVDILFSYGRHCISNYKTAFDFMVIWSKDCLTVKNVISTTENVLFAMENVRSWWFLGLS